MNKENLTRDNCLRDNWVEGFPVEITTHQNDKRNNTHLILRYVTKVWLPTIGIHVHLSNEVSLNSIFNSNITPYSTLERS